VWHASVSAPIGVSGRVRRRLARKALAGVGDRAHEWEEDRPIAQHLRRRLTPAEAATIAPVADLRGTEEGWARLARVRVYLPTEVWSLALEELRDRSAS
jgi:hypothetical protein